MVLAVLLALAALGVSRAEASSPVTEASFLATATRDERVLAVLAEPLAAAGAERARAGLLPNPEAAFEREALSGEPRQDAWSLSWTLPIDGRRGLAVRAAGAGLAAAERRHDRASLFFRIELREAYARWALAEEAAAFGARVADLAGDLHRQAELQASRGEGSQLSARRLLLAQVEVEAEAARLSAELAHARGRVRAWLPNLAADAIPAPPSLPPVPTDSLLWARSPQLAEQEHAVQQAEAKAALADRFWALPELSVGRQSLADEAVGPVVGLRWTLPLFDRKQGDRLATRAELAAARARQGLAESRLREEFAAARAAYATLSTAAASAAAAGPAAERVLNAAAALYAAGESDITDLLETLRGALSGQLAAIAAHGEALRAHRELEWIAGQPLALTEGDER